MAVRTTINIPDPLHDRLRDARKREDVVYVRNLIQGPLYYPDQDVVVSDGAIVDGPVYAQNIVMEGGGKIYGEVFALNRLNIRSNAVLSGDSYVSRTSMEDGAFFKGGIEIRKMPWSLPPPPSDGQNT